MAFCRDNLFMYSISRSLSLSFFCLRWQTECPQTEQHTSPTNLFQTSSLNDGDTKHTIRSEYHWSAINAHYMLFAKWSSKKSASYSYRSLHNYRQSIPFSRKWRERVIIAVPNYLFQLPISQVVSEKHLPKSKTFCNL